MLSFPSQKYVGKLKVPFKPQQSNSEESRQKLNSRYLSQCRDVGGKFKTPESYWYKEFRYLADGVEGSSLVSGITSGVLLNPGLFRKLAHI